MQAEIAGFALGLSLILVIGAQNVFVLHQGLRREHVLAVVLICALSDAVLITFGVVGFGALSTAVPGLERVMRFGGAAFLIWYGARNFLAAWRGGAVLEASAGTGSLRRAMLTSLGLTWLNPHVYLDTVVLVGSVSSQYGDRLGLGLGAVGASFVFFFCLGYGARLLAPLFRRKASWRVLDAGIGAVMWAIAARLLAG